VWPRRRWSPSVSPWRGVRAQVEQIIGHGQQAPSGHIPFTPRAKKVLELSVRGALQLGHNYDQRQALEAAATLADRYISDRFLPAKALVRRRPPEVACYVDGARWPYRGRGAAR
jgi:AAA lid domain